MARTPRRSTPRVNPDPKLSHEPHDKLMACLHWHYGKFKNEPDYVRAPYYFDAVYQWFQKLSLDDTERVYVVQQAYFTLRGWKEDGEPVALRYAEDLPPVPPWPFK